jgi:hypothetical protein
MNNNNLYNTNNFIGITHNDYFKTASNALSTAIITTSNILNSNSSNYTSNVSNILNTNSSNYTRNTSNAILARYDPLIKQEIEHKILPFPATLNHTYIYNSNVAGEIRFWCKSTSDYPVVIPLGVPDYRVKIDVDGKLKVYYTYDPLINLTFGNGWVDVGNSIAGLNASDANIGISISALEIQTNNNFTFLQQEIEVLIIQLNAEDVIDNAQQASLEYSLETFRTEFFNDITNTNVSSLLNIPRNVFNTGTTAYASRCITAIAYKITQNPLVSSFLGIGGIAFAFAFAAGQNLAFGNYYLNQLKKEFTNSNVNTTPSRKLEVLQLIEDTKIDNFMDYCSNMSNMTIAQGYINTYNTSQQYIPFLKSDTLDLNTGNITNINGITANELITSGKIKENNKFLDATYLTSNHLYNLAFNYTAERQYPAKAYTTSSPETTVSLLGKQVYKQTLYLDTTTISYGSGFYEIYSSSTYDNGIIDKNKLFNYNTTETTNIPRFGISLYNSGTGNYQGNNSIDNVYFGDWIIIKLPQQIMLSRYKIYQSTQNPFPTKAPAEWKCYGSNDGITFTEITEASQMTRLTTYTFGFYEKTLNPTFTTQYQWIGFVFNKLLSTSGQTDLSFVELQIFGKEIISNSIVSNIYATSNAVKSIIRYDMPDVGKRQAFYVSIPITATYYDGTSATTYYKYDLDLRNYTKTQTIALTSDLMRVFKIRFWYVPSYFGSYINSEPYVSSYEVYMSNKLNPVLGRPETAGLNIYAVGFPENNKLANILPNQLMLLRNVSGSLDYLTIVSRTAPADVYVIIECMLS